MRAVAFPSIVILIALASNACSADVFDVANAHEIEAIVLARNALGFRYVEADYHTGSPLRGSRHIGEAHLAKSTVLEFSTTTREMRPGHARDIKAGDSVRIYGYRRGASPYWTVYRLEDRGRLVR